MNKYDYLAGTHDLASLSDWGPFARDIYALSHIADRKRGIKFDFCFIPGINHRPFFPPETLRECNCSPYEAAPDLSYFMIRQQMESQGLDLYYTDSAYACIGKDLWLGRCEFVNKTNEVRAGSLLICTRLAPRPDVTPFLPENARFIDALDYADLQYSYKRFDHNLVHSGGKRGEQNYPGTVNNRCLGGAVYHHRLPCFAAKKGDTVSYQIAANKDDKVIFGRIRVDVGESQEITLTVNGQSKNIVLQGTGNFELIELYRGDLNGSIAMTITSAQDSCGIRVDGYIVGAEPLQAGDIRFAPLGRAVSPEVKPGPMPNSNSITGSGIDHSYCVWWSQSASAEREYWVPSLPALANYSYGLRQPYFRYWDTPGDEFCHDAYVLPLETAPGASKIIYTLYSAGADPAAAAEAIEKLDKSEANLEKLFLEARKRASIPAGNPAGQKYEFSQQLMAATSLTNINFPISKQGNNIRHHVPDKFFNSLYSWDSGFIGLGFLELDKTRAIENLNVYVTDPGDENKFLLYGTPMPVQIYLFAEIWNRYQDREMLEFFYPRLRQFYKFIAGHYPTSSYRKNSSNLLVSWDYFYNSGGWDDYPPQWYLAKKMPNANIAPAVTTTHAIRFAKFLSQAARELGATEDLAMYESDVKAFGDALQKYSWSEKDAIFSYVEHDDQGNVIGQWMDPASGENFNFGMDGTCPLTAGICTADQQEKLYARLQDPARMWSDIGISTVDKSAPYFRTDGYWNGCVWMPHQWFFWKTALNDNRKEFARQIAKTALDVWANEVNQSRYCFEHFSMSSHRGAGCCHFGALSSPVLNWYGAYFAPQRFTVGLDTWIRSKSTGRDYAEAELVIDGNAGEFCTVLYVAGSGSWQALYNGQAVECAMGLEGCLEITLPKSTSGKLEIKRI